MVNEPLNYKTKFLRAPNSLLVDIFKTTIKIQTLPLKTQDGFDFY